MFPIESGFEIIGVFVMLGLFSCWFLIDFNTKRLHDSGIKKTKFIKFLKMRMSRYKFVVLLLLLLLLLLLYYILKADGFAQAYMILSVFGFLIMEFVIAGKLIFIEQHVIRENKVEYKRFLRERRQARKVSKAGKREHRDNIKNKE